MPILTALAPPGFNIAEMLDINKNFKKLLGQISSYSDDELWIALENLLKKGAYVNIPLPLGDGDRFLLDAACCLGKLSTLQLLIENGAYTTSPTRQLTLLEETILAGQSEVVAYLLTKNINERSVLTTKYNDTLLHLAKTIEVAKVILNHIDDINATNIDGETALHKAIGSAEIRPFYGEQEEKTGDLGFVKFLLENHANIDSKNEKGQTPLYLAINKQDYQIAEYLLQNKAAVEIADENENTVLHLAVKRGSLPLVKLLLRYGANVHAKNKSGATPFDIAADQPSLFEAMSIHYSAPLDDQADYPQYSEILLFLLQNGIDINNANGKSDPLLHLAIAYKDFDAVRYLVEKLGADINVKDSDCSTALSKAQNSSPAEIVKYLVEKATDIAENLDKDESKSKSNQQNIGTLAKLGTFSHREVKNSVPETGFSPKPHPK